MYLLNRRIFHAAHCLVIDAMLFNSTHSLLCRAYLGEEWQSTLAHSFTRAALRCRRGGQWRVAKPVANITHDGPAVRYAHRYTHRYLFVCMVEVVFLADNTL